MQEVSKLSEQREELYETIRNMPDSYVEKVLKMVNLFLEPTTDEMEKWWEKNIDTLEPSDIMVTAEDMKNIEKMNFQNWDDIKGKI